MSTRHRFQRTFAPRHPRPRDFRRRRGQGALRRFRRADGCPPHPGGGEVLPLHGRQRDQARPEAERTAAEPVRRRTEHAPTPRRSMTSRLPSSTPRAPSCRCRRPSTWPWKPRSRPTSSTTGRCRRSKTPKVKELFVELRDEEKRHQEMIEEARAKMPEDDDFDPDDFVDGPAAQ